jgi:hypothetical protein
MCCRHGHPLVPPFHETLVKQIYRGLQSEKANYFGSVKLMSGLRDELKE